MKIEYLNEIWRAAIYIRKDGTIVDFTGLYEVSTFGKVRGVDRFKISKYGRKIFVKGVPRKQFLRGGYYVVQLSINGIPESYNVHRLVASTFPELCGKYFKDAVCNHKDENKLNNVATNIEWITFSENIRYGESAKSRANKLSIPLLQFDKQNNFIKEWDSSSEVQKEMGWNPRHISCCCLGLRKSAYGYIWKYKETV